MKTNIIYLLFLFLNFGYAQKINKTIALPDIKTCEEPISLNDPNEREFNRINGKIIRLSYSTLYSYTFSGYDSLQRDNLRFEIAKISQQIVTKVLPQVKLLNDSIFLRKTYNEIMFNTVPIKQYKRYRTAKNLIIEDNSDYQLFIESLFSVGIGKNMNSISFFVFDLKKGKIVYFDRMHYNCDIRDLKALEKVLTYGLLKIKEKY
ncbi:hypothetical protein C1T31_12220 [Hanstruepera neustonica]|uniref:Uncharacterized protein n=1 Tax=Hanstruepera neustonica TaxID=1445657 RepID=A0A2K1DWA3_9FLAO|nr:hypothetical protein [Hanstruepera neustonica]PNQ72310.1 hypothetical protein C1T31_12220 [Hanstruepera neustonica]